MIFKQTGLLKVSICTKDPSTMANRMCLCTTCMVSCGSMCFIFSPPQSGGNTVAEYLW